MTQTAKVSCPWQIDFSSEAEKWKCFARACLGNEKMAKVLEQMVYLASWEAKHQGLPKGCKAVKFSRTHKAVMENFNFPITEKTYIHYRKRFNDWKYITTDRYGRCTEVNFEAIRTAFVTPPVRPPRQRTKSCREKPESCTTTLQDSEQLLQLLAEKDRMIQELTDKVVTLQENTVTLQLNVVTLQEKVSSITTLQHRLEALEKLAQGPKNAPTMIHCDSLCFTNERDGDTATTDHHHTPAVLLDDFVFRVAIEDWLRRKAEQDPENENENRSQSEPPQERDAHDLHGSVIPGINVDQCVHVGCADHHHHHPDSATPSDAEAGRGHTATSGPTRIPGNAKEMDIHAGLPGGTSGLTQSGSPRGRAGTPTLEQERDAHDRNRTPVPGSSVSAQPTGDLPHTPEHSHRTQAASQQQHSQDAGGATAAPGQGIPPTTTGVGDEHGYSHRHGDDHGHCVSGLPPHPIGETHEHVTNGNGSHRGIRPGGDDRELSVSLTDPSAPDPDPRRAEADESSDQTTSGRSVTERQMPVRGAVVAAGKGLYESSQPTSYSPTSQPTTQKGKGRTRREKEPAAPKPDPFAEASPEVQAIALEWQCIFVKKPIVITDTVLRHATTLAKYQPDPGEIAACRLWMYQTDKKGYYRGRGMQLGDVVREFENFRSLANMPEPEPTKGPDRGSETAQHPPMGQPDLAEKAARQEKARQVQQELIAKRKQKEAEIAAILGQSAGKEQYSYAR